MTTSANPAKPYTLLLVEDNLIEAKLTRHALAQTPDAGFRLEHVDRLHLAVNRLAQGGVDVLLVDLILPDSSGIATFQAIRAAAPTVPIIVLTGMDDERLALETLKQGAQDYLFKDEVHPKLLVRSLRFAIERHRAAALETLNEQLEQAQATLTKTVHRLEQANEELAQFTYFASHDLQEPVRKLIWFTALLAEDAGDGLNEAARKDMQFITEAARRMQALVHSLLSLCRAGQAAIESEPVELASCAAQALDGLAARIAETGAECICDPLPVVAGDATLLVQLYQNLLNNALKFTDGARPRICLTAEPAGNAWVLGVRDNGIGIEPKFAQRIFAPFQRLHTRSEYEGTGIGLAICKKVVERHGGRIWVESAPGAGARARTGLVVDAYFSGTKLAWLLDNVPGARRAAENGALAFGTIDSFLLWRLTGGRVHATDATNASRTMLFDIVDQRWDPRMLEALRIPAAVLPEVRDCSGEFGATDPELFGAAIPILGIAGDQQAATVGQACFRPGMGKSTYGTGCFMLVNTGERCVASANRLLTTVAYRLAGRTTYALEGSIFVAGATVQWLRDGLRVISSATQSETLARDLRSTEGVYLVPAFTGLGAPHWDPDARAAILGLTRDSGVAHIVRAGLEAVAYQTADLADAFVADMQGAAAEAGLGTLRVDGGMVVNDWLCQFLADMLDRPVERPAVVETTALGAAYLAGLAAGLYGSLDEIAGAWRLERRFEPTMSADDRQRLLDGWRRAVARVRG